MLTTDYLVVGAGAASMAFIDTLLTEQPNATVVVVDKHEAPGGHWNDAYGFVHLHQPSLLYGVASKQMEGSWLKLMALKGTLPWNHRASKTEILAHYKLLMDEWVASGRVQYYPNSTYLFERQPMATIHDDDKTHFFVDNSTSTTMTIRVDKKLVNGVLGECRVPSQTPPQFHVDTDVPIKTPNQVFEQAATDKNNRKKSWIGGIRRSNNDNKQYVVLGCGKTALDTVVFLQKKLHVPAGNISWVAPNDIWMLRRAGPGSPYSWGDALLRSDGDANKAGLLLEQEGVFARLDKSILPTKFRFPVIGDDELAMAQKVKTNMIRRGRVTSIETLEDGSFKVSFSETPHEPIVFSNNHTFVHCTSPGPFNKNAIRDIFPNDKAINLLLIYAPPVPISMSSIALVESRLQNGMLDLDFARQLLRTHDNSSNIEYNDESEVLNALLQGYGLGEELEDEWELAQEHMKPIKVLAIFLAILDKDPLVGHKWLKENRLSFFSVPGFKGEVLENIRRMIATKDALRFSDTQIQQLELLVDKLQPLEGM